MIVHFLLLLKAAFVATTLVHHASCFTASTDFPRYTYHRPDNYLKSRLSKTHLVLHTTTSNTADQGGEVCNDLNTSVKNNKGSNPYITFHHPVYHTEITLIGCLHGSSSSAHDVSTILDQSFTDIVVLELCPTRYKDLMRDLARRKEGGVDVEVEGGDYFKMVRKTIEARGIATGIAAAILGGASGISTALSGFEPGLEFITAMNYVEDMNTDRRRSGSSSERDTERVDVVLADQIVDETLRRVGGLPSVSLEMLQVYLGQGLNWEDTYGSQATVLRNAIIGDDDKLGGQVNLGKALVRNSQVVQDLVRLTLPTFVMLQFANLVFSGFLGAMGSDTTSEAFSSSDIMIDTLSMMSIGDWGLLTGDIMFELISSGLILFLGYVLVALPTVKLILTERDYQLAKGIDDACLIVSQKYANEKKCGSGRVVAVLGFLHVNGVKNLLQQQHRSP